MHRRWHQHAAMLRIPAHQQGFSRGRRAVIHTGVADVHARQLADHCLIFKNGLQQSLTHFRLIRRIRRQKLAAAGQRVDETRDVMAVSARPAVEIFINPVV